MTQYLLSVYTTDADERDPEGDELQTDLQGRRRLQRQGQDRGALGVRRRPGADRGRHHGRRHAVRSAIVTDGPFAESKEYLGGFWVIEAPDLDAALTWATEGSAACAGKVEVRPFQRPSRRALETTVRREVERVFREEYGRVVASLVRRFGDIDVAEEAAGEALLVALEKWPVDGVPPNPGGWLTTTAGNKAIDRLRREARARTSTGRRCHVSSIDGAEPHEPTGVVTDDRLRLIFTCCHPALAPEARVALTLRLLGGLTVAEIAEAFLVPETTMAQRITRAKKKIKVARIPYRVPGAGRPRRARSRRCSPSSTSSSTRATSPPRATAPIREELTGEAIRLGRRPARAAARRARGRRAARPDAADRGPAHGPRRRRRAGPAARAGPRWLGPRADRRGPRAGARVPRASTGPGSTSCSPRSTPSTPTPRPRPTPTGTRSPRSTPSCTPSSPTPVVALNRAVAVAELDGPEVALAEVDRLDLTTYHAWHATRADLLRRLGRSAEARAAYDAAIAATANEAERAYLTRRRGTLAK